MAMIHRRAVVHLAGAMSLWAWGHRPAQAQTAPPAPGSAPFAPPAPPLPALGSRLVVPATPLLDGGRFEPAAAEGQVLVIYWWASWCPFCAVVSPLMDQLWRAQAAQGLQFLGLSIDKTPADAKAYLAKRGLAFPSAWVSPDMARALPKPKGLPVTLVRGRDGRVVMAEAGQLFPEDVAEIARLL